MFQDIQVIGGSVLTLFLLMAVGFFLGKRGMLSKETRTQLSKLLLCVVTPCIIVSTFLSQAHDSQTVRKLVVSGLVLAGIYLLNMILIHPWFRRSPSDDRGVLRFISIYGNTGFMGIPLIQAVLGEPGMLTTAVSIAIFNVATWTHGNYLIGGREQISVKRALLNPGVIGFAGALVLFGLRVNVPAPIHSAIDFMGNLNTPLAMVIIGGQMAETKLKEVFASGRLFLISAIKLLAVPLITMLVLLPFHIDEVVYVAVVILSGCPVAGASGLFCQMAGKDTSLAAGGVTLSTILCIVTLPVVVMAARALQGLF